MNKIQDRTHRPQTQPITLADFLARNLARITQTAQDAHLSADSAMIAHVQADGHYRLIAKSVGRALDIAQALNNEAFTEFSNIVLVARLNRGIPLLLIRACDADSICECGYSIIKRV